MIRSWRDNADRERLADMLTIWTWVLPGLSVLVMLLASAVLPIVNTLPFLPDLGLMQLVAWRLYRADLMPPWLAFPLGMAADIFMGQPVGVNATAWPATLLALALAEQRLPLRDMRVDWVLASVAILGARLLGWWLLALCGYSLPASPILLVIAATILFFPLVARWTAWMERKWLAVAV